MKFQSIKHITYTILLTIVFVNGYFGQVLITDPDFVHPSNPMDCAGQFDNTVSTANFFDSGNNSANYGNSENETITFCPDAAGSKVFFVSDVNASYIWEISAGDSLRIYDGPSTASSLIGSYNSFTHPAGLSFVSSSFANTSGCLTFEFVSDASNDSTGWEARVSCYTPNQPIEPHVTAHIYGEATGSNDQVDDMTNYDLSMALADSGYVNLCQGDSIRLINTSNYPYEPGGSSGPDFGGGYGQSDPTEHTTQWTFSDGTTVTGDSIWFYPPAGMGILAAMEVIDNQGESANMDFKIRSSTTPSFEECAPLDETICLGQYTELLGGVTATDTVGVEAQESGFSAEGVFGDPLFIPDNQTSVYTTDIDITGYPAGTTITNPSDLTSVCVSIEHTFLGDLEMMITCPNGQSSILFNSYNGTFSGQLFPGGFGGGSIFLGGANDQSGSAGLTQGVCETYCFTEAAGANPAWASGFSTTTASGPSTGSMVVPGDYNPEGSFATDLLGCPLNGTWTLTTKDNWSSDDGWICSWEIVFDTIFTKPDETYLTSIVWEEWAPDPTILFGENDTAIIVVPNTVGNNPYTFEVQDNYGCYYDTTIIVEVINGSSIMPGDYTCSNFTFSGTNAPTIGSTTGGIWSAEGPGNISFSPSNTSLNPTISADEDGDYIIYFSGNACQDTASTTVSFVSEPVATIYGTDTVCQGDTAMFYTFTNFGESYDWESPSGSTISTDSLAYGLEDGVHTLIVSNVCGSDTAMIDLVIESCEVPNVITPNGDNVNDVFKTRYADVYSDVILIIYNRWGRVVYETESYDNTWGGEKKNGKPIADGVYFYVMKWDEGTKDEAGTITVFVE